MHAEPAPDQARDSMATRTAAAEEGPPSKDRNIFLNLYPAVTAGPNCGARRSHSVLPSVTRRAVGPAQPSPAWAELRRPGLSWRSSLWVGLRRLIVSESLRRGHWHSPGIMAFASTPVRLGVGPGARFKLSESWSHWQSVIRVIHNVVNVWSKM